jgi:hypothetical protein
LGITLEGNLWKIFEKLSSNFSLKAISTIGPYLYTRYVGKFIVSIPKILRTHDLAYLDKVMGERALRFNYRSSHFLFDTRYCDNHIRDGTFAFGIVREIYIRDCYFKFHSPDVFLSSKIVVDLGANRGAFSVLMASRANFVVSVEAQSEFVPIIDHNMAINGFSNYRIHCGFIGAGGVLGEGNYPSVTLEQIFECYGIQKVDFVKIDIEGSEFGLFASPGWLEKVRALSVEVHPKYGVALQILDTLEQHNFEYVLADENLCSTTDEKRASFIYAWKHSNKLLWSKL